MTTSETIKIGDCFAYDSPITHKTNVFCVIELLTSRFADWNAKIEWEGGSIDHKLSTQLGYPGWRCATPAESMQVIKAIQRRNEAEIERLQDLNSKLYVAKHLMLQVNKESNS